MGIASLPLMNSIKCFPASHFMERYEALNQKSNKIIIWLEERNTKAKEYEKKLQTTPKKFSKKRRLRIEKLIKQNKRNISHSLRRFRVISEQFCKDLIREQKKYIDQGYTFHKSNTAWSASAIEQYFTPTYTDNKPVFRVAENSLLGVQIPITFNKDSKTIWVGSLELNKPFIAPKGDHSSEKVLWRVFSESGFNVPFFPCDKVINRKILCWIYGGKSDIYLRKLSYFLWVAKHEKIIGKFCRLGKSLSHHLIVRMHESINEVNKAIGHQEEHLIPAIIFFNSDINSIKKVIGPYLWKRIVNNTASRNHLLFKILYNFDQFKIRESHDLFSSRELLRASHDYGVYFGKNDYSYCKPHLQKTKEILEFLIDVPTSLMKNESDNHIFDYNYENEVDTTIVQWVVKVAKEKRILGKKEDLRHYFTIISDTRRMALKLNASFSQEWSYRRMNETHNKYAREVALIGHVDFNFEFKYCWPDNIDHDGINATLIKTSGDLIIEGIEMRHCVGSYVADVASGQCIIYSLRHSVSNIRSTLQIGLGRRANELAIWQHEGLYNEPIGNAETQARFDECANAILGLAQTAFTPKGTAKRLN